MLNYHIIELNHPRAIPTPHTSMFGESWGELSVSLVKSLTALQAMTTFDVVGSSLPGE